METAQGCLPSQPSPLKETYEQVWAEIRAAAGAERAQDPRLVAVSKQQEVAKILGLYHCGQRVFGENYAQELQLKAVALQALPLTWVFVGRLQSNKLKTVVRYAHEIQSVASFRHAELIARYVQEFGRPSPYPIFLALNSGAEQQKDGLALDKVEALAAQIQQELPSLAVQGIMAIPPLAWSQEAAQGNVPAGYRDLRSLADRIGAGKLSLGMSQDMQAAIRAGSDVVRVGSRLFGARDALKTKGGWV